MRLKLPLIIVLELIFLLECPWIGQAQEEPPTRLAPPPRPYVGALTGEFTFTKVITYKAQPKKKELPEAQQTAVPTPDIEKLEVVQKSGLREDKISYVDGTSAEIWRSGPARFIIRSTNPKDVIFIIPSPDVYQDEPDFKELKWVNGNLYQGEKSLQEKKCYVYKLNDQTVWIDETSHLPIYFESTTMQVAYTYKTAPGGPFQMPAYCTKRFDEIMRACSGKPNY